MLKRYLLLGSALCFMVVGVTSCPYPFTYKSVRPHFVQAPATINPVGTSASAAHL